MDNKAPILTTGDLPKTKGGFINIPESLEFIRDYYHDYYTKQGNGKVEPQIREKIAEELYYQHKGEFLEKEYRKQNKWITEEPEFKREFYNRANKVVAILSELSPLDKDVIINYLTNRQFEFNPTTIDIGTDPTDKSIAWVTDLTVSGYEYKGLLTRESIQIIADAILEKE